MNTLGVNIFICSFRIILTVKTHFFFVLHDHEHLVSENFKWMRS
mgnify:CR=1 FL=1